MVHACCRHQPDPNCEVTACAHKPISVGRPRNTRHEVIVAGEGVDLIACHEQMYYRSTAEALQKHCRSVTVAPHVGGGVAHGRTAIVKSDHRQPTATDTPELTVTDTPELYCLVIRCRGEEHSVWRVCNLG